MEAHIHPVTHPLQLNRYFIKKLAFSLNEGFDRRPIPSSKEIHAQTVPEMGIEVITEHNPDNAYQWRVEVRVELGESEDQSFPYIVSGSVVGYFNVNKKHPKENVAYLAKINGASLLYTTMREVIANITSRTHYPRLLLPVVSFHEMPETIDVTPSKGKRKKRASQKASSSVSKKK